MREVGATSGPMPRSPWRRNMTLVNAGNSSFDISGRVQGDGAVAVKISYGQKTAAGSGAQPRLPVALIFACLVIVYVGIRYFWR